MNYKHEGKIYIDISKDKLSRFLTRRRRHSYEKGNLMREIKSYQIAAENNTIRTNEIKVKIDNI